VSSAEPVVELIDVRKEFDHGRVKALDGLSLTVARGEFQPSARSWAGEGTCCRGWPTWGEFPPASSVVCSGPSGTPP